MSDNKSTEAAAAASDAAVEALSLAMIREYLHTRGLKKTLATLGDELPVKPTPTTRTAMTKDLGLAKMLSKNKKRAVPYATLIEVVTRYLYDKRVEAEGNGGAPTPTTAAPAPVAASTPPVAATNARSATSTSAASSGRIGSNVSDISSTTRRDSSSLSRPVVTSNLTSATASRPTSATSSRVTSDMMVQELDLDDEFNSGASHATSKGTETKTSTAASLPLSSFRGVAITGDEAVQLRDVVFGQRETQGKFPSCWTKQGFHFRPAAECKAAPSLSVGLIQNEGGPCGLLAAVQAYFIKDLLFKASNGTNSESAQRQLLAINISQQRASLIAALTEMLWMVGGGGMVRVAIPGTGSRLTSPPKNYRNDGITETLTIYQLTSQSELQSFITSSYDVWSSARGLGAVALLYSLVLTRGIANVKVDKDDEWQVLVVDGGYCTQELVNLALTGRATSNVFDSNKVVDGKTYRGVEAKSNIGFLSRFELAGNVLVGSYYKQPNNPIWVVCSESHYSVLWALTRVPKPGVFDLWYYDELAQQTEEIRLTVDTRNPAPLPKSRDPEPPINECIRTRWGATTRVDWNGVDPIL